VDEADAIVRIAEQAQKSPHPLELQVARLGRAHLIVDAAVPEAQGFVVGHGVVSYQ
jgi:hypothetical protein